MVWPGVSPGKWLLPALSPGVLPGFLPRSAFQGPYCAGFVPGLLPEIDGFVPGLLPVPVTRTCPRVLPASRLPLVCCTMVLLIRIQCNANGNFLDYFLNRGRRWLLFFLVSASSTSLPPRTIAISLCARLQSSPPPAHGKLHSMAAGGFGHSDSCSTATDTNKGST